MAQKTVTKTVISTITYDDADPASLGGRIGMARRWGDKEAERQAREALAKWHRDRAAQLEAES